MRPICAAAVLGLTLLVPLQQGAAVAQAARTRMPPIAMGEAWDKDQLDRCPALGFDIYGREDRSGSVGRGRVQQRVPGPRYAPNIAPPPPLSVPRVQIPPNSPPVSAPPPPPPPPPSFSGQAARADQSQSEVIVSGSRIPRDDFARRYERPPGDIDTERYPEARPNAVTRVAEAPVSTFSIDVDTASYANVRRFIAEGEQPPRDAVRVEEMINYFRYDYPQPERRESFAAWAATAPSPWNAGREVLQVALTGRDIDRRRRPPLNLVFLVDVSGSMDPEDRLPLAQRALHTLIEQLRPQDEVAMVVYAGASGVVLDSTRGDERLRLHCAVEALKAGGSTAGGEGLALAYRVATRNFDPDAVNRVVLLTDGDFNVGVTNNRSLEDFVADQRRTGVYLSVYGFGRGNYQDARMQTLSQAGNGTAAYIDTEAEATRVFRDDFAGSMFPIADDVKIQIEFNPARVSDYRLIGYETRLLRREDFTNDAVDAGEVNAGATVTALYEITPVGGAPSVPPLRYQRERRPAAAEPSGEIAYLRWRYKPPGGDTSTERARAITDADRHASLERAPENLRWAVAVAGYGQLLRGDPATGRRFGWGDVDRLARSAVGRDEDGRRTEFLALARDARGLTPLVEAR